MTGNANRHRFIVNKLESAGLVQAVVVEAKRSPYDPKAHRDDSDQDVLDTHFSRRDEAERKHLGRAPPTVAPSRMVDTGTINDPAVVEWIERHDPDLILLYGTSIIRGPLLDQPDVRLINLHLGLSPYYRGAGTNVWPLVHGKPEYVGATIHEAVAAVDAGPILGQVRPGVAPGDTSYDLGPRTIVAAGDVLPDLLTQYHAGLIEPVPQAHTKGPAYRRDDFQARHVRQIWANDAAGMIDQYLTDRQNRDRAAPIVATATTRTKSVPS